VSNTSRSIRPGAVAGGGISQPGEDRSTARLPVAVLIALTMSLKGDGLRADRVDRDVVRTRAQLGAGAREVIDVDRPDPVAACR
jgi:hypothetical protein